MKIRQLETMKNTIIKFVSLSILLIPVALVAKPSSSIVSKNMELQQLNQQIQQLQQTIQNAQSQREKTSKVMQQNQLKLAELRERVTILTKEIAKQQAVLKNVQQQQTNYQTQAEQTRHLLAQELQAAYQLHREQDNAVTLTPTTLETNLRLENYLSYLMPIHIDKVNVSEQTLNVLKDKQQKIVQHKHELLTTLTLQQKTQSQLTAVQQEQQKNLQLLNSQLQTKNLILKKLLANRQALEHLLKELAKAKQTRRQAVLKPLPNTKTVAVLPASAPFTKLQGKLPWPTVGTIINHFGSPIEQSELHSTGVLIKAPVGQAVHTIYQGRVVFANHLQGLGLLIIVDHGNGYLSLYGHNQALYKKVGETVRADDVIASVGNSSYQAVPGVYFEIRLNSKALNPELWCRVNA